MSRMKPPQARIPEAVLTFPDFMLDPDAVLKDNATWRSGKAPDYSNTRQVYDRSKSPLKTVLQRGICTLILVKQRDKQNTQAIVWKQW